MTYSQFVKEELCVDKFTCDNCNKAFVDGLLLFRNVSEIGVLFQSHNENIVDILAQKIVEVTGVMVKKNKTRVGKSKRYIYTLNLEMTEDIDRFYKDFGYAITYRIDKKSIKKSCCKSAFMRGVFLSCGVIVNPEKEYHFEFKIPNEDLANQLFEFLSSMPLNFKKTKRKDNYIVYLKGSEEIEEVLTFMGATKSALKIMDIKILKEVRNNVNRVTNCETANIGKTVKASMQQVEDINYIIHKKGKSYLSDDLKEVAKVRLENPEMSLRELCEVIPSGISRSGLNHRLKRLSKMAQDLREEKVM